MLYKTRGYLIKFDEKVGGMQGRNVSRNWIRYWTVLDGSSMLFYRDEEVRVYPRKIVCFKTFVRMRKRTKSRCFTSA